MHTNVIGPALVDTKRLDPDYYHPDHLETERVLKDLKAEPLKKAGTFWAGPFGSELPNSLYLSTGIPLFRVGNVGSMQVIDDGMAYLDPSVHEHLSASEVRSGDLLVVKASVGEKICRIPDRIPKANITKHIIAIRPNGRADFDYLSAFLFGRYGRSQLVRRSLGSIIQYLGVNDARTVLYPAFDGVAQNYIGNKVRQAEKLREFARLLEVEVSDTFAHLSDGLPKSPKAWRTAGGITDSYRLNPSHYDAVVLKMLKDAEAIVKLSSVDTLIGERGISGGATPLGAMYCDSGVFFVRVQNVKPYGLDLSDAAYLSADQDAELARSRCNSDEIIYSITGYPGTASLVMNDDLPININQHCVRFDIRSPYDAAYVAAALNSPFVKRQVDRLAIGGTRDALDYPSVRSLLIPILSELVMKKVSQQVRLLNKAKRMSQRLVIAAKSLTEGLIDGEISESELIEIQQAIEKGENEGDRKLLERLTPNGLDRADSPKLFQDLDVLFQLLVDLSSAEQKETV